MKKFRRLAFTRQSYALLLFFSLLTLGCSKGFKDYYDEENTKGGFLYDKIKSNPEFSTFTKGLERANLVQFISEGGLYTVFAPTNDAFSKYLNSNGYSSIDAVPLTKLSYILSYHIVHNMWYYYDFKVRFASTKQTLYLTRNKKFVNVDVTTPDALKVNNIPVVNTLQDIDADNGVIHGIGELLTALSNIEEVFVSDAELTASTFYKLMQLVRDSTYDPLQTFDKDRDGKVDSVFYKTYSLLGGAFPTIDYRQSTAATSQGGEPVFTTVIMPSNAALDAFIAPALSRIPGTVQDKIAALSPSYAEALLESYFIADSTVISSKLIAPPLQWKAINGQNVPVMPDNQFVRKDIKASNGLIHVINTMFPPSPALLSAIGQVMTDPDLSMYLAAIQKAGLMFSWANPTRTGTFFAPTNAAFAAAGFDVKAGTLNGALLTSTQFGNIVRHHLIPSASLTKAGLTGTRDSDLGNTQQLIFRASGDSVISAAGIGAKITHPEAGKGPGNPASGYVYKVDKLLLPR